MYKHYHYEFTEREIEQIVALLRAFMTHDLNKPVDARRLSYQVRQWATGLYFLEWRNTDGECSSWDKGARLYYCDNLRYGFEVELIPVEVLWRIVAPMLTETPGYSLTRNKGWVALNISPVRGWVAEEPTAMERALREMQEVLGRLQSWGYIYYQYAGTVWSISVLDRAA